MKVSGRRGSGSSKFRTYANLLPAISRLLRCQHRCLGYMPARTRIKLAKTRWIELGRLEDDLDVLVNAW